MTEIWACPGCGHTYSDNNPDMITEHVQRCDYVDGAGNPVKMTVKWSSVHWYLAEIDVTELAEAHGLPLPPVAKLLGELDDGDPVAEYLTELEEESDQAVFAFSDKVDISAIYPASRDHPERRPVCTYPNCTDPTSPHISHGDH